jgi:hypothetical protein
MLIAGSVGGLCEFGGGGLGYGGVLDRHARLAI